MNNTPKGMQKKLTTAQHSSSRDKNKSPTSLRESLILEVCKNDFGAYLPGIKRDDQLDQVFQLSTKQLHDNIKRRLHHEKKEQENKIVQSRLQNKITKMFSAKAMSPHGHTNFLPFEQNAVMRRVDSEDINTPLGNLNNLRNKLKTGTRDDLNQIINIHANKKSVGAQKHDKYANNQITANNKVRQSFEADMRVDSVPSLQIDSKQGSDISFDGSPQGLSVSQLQMTTSKVENNQQNESNQSISNALKGADPDQVFTIGSDQMKKRKKDIASLKISTIDKQRLHKRREMIISMKFIRNVGKRLRDDLEKQGVVIRKLQRSRTIRMKQIRDTSFRQDKQHYKKMSQEQLGNFNIFLATQNKKKSKSPNDASTALSPIKYDTSRIRNMDDVTPEELEKQRKHQSSSKSGLSGSHQIPPNKKILSSLSEQDISREISSSRGTNAQAKPFTERIGDLRLEIPKAKDSRNQVLTGLNSNTSELLNKSLVQTASQHASSFSKQTKSQFAKQKDRMVTEESDQIFTLSGRTSQNKIHQIHLFGSVEQQSQISPNLSKVCGVSVAPSYNDEELQMLKRIGVDRNLQEEEQFLSEDSSDTLSSVLDQDKETRRRNKFNTNEMETSISGIGPNSRNHDFQLNLDKNSSSKSQKQRISTVSTLQQQERNSKVSEDYEEDKFDESELKGYSKNKYTLKKDKSSKISLDCAYLNQDVDRIDGLQSPNTPQGLSPNAHMLSNQDSSSEYYYRGMVEQTLIFQYQQFKNQQEIQIQKLQGKNLSDVSEQPENSNESASGEQSSQALFKSHQIRLTDIGFKNEKDKIKKTVKKSKTSMVASKQDYLLKFNNSSKSQKKDGENSAKTKRMKSILSFDESLNEQSSVSHEDQSSVTSMSEGFFLKSNQKQQVQQKIVIDELVKSSARSGLELPDKSIKWSEKKVFNYISKENSKKNSKNPAKSNSLHLLLSNDSDDTPKSISLTLAGQASKTIGLFDKSVGTPLEEQKRFGKTVDEEGDIDNNDDDSQIDRVASSSSSLTSLSPGTPPRGNSGYSSLSSQSLSSLNESEEESLEKLKEEKSPLLKLAPMPRRQELDGIEDNDVTENEEYFLTEIEIQNNQPLMNKITREEKLLREEMSQVKRQILQDKRPKKLQSCKLIQPQLRSLLRRGSRVSISKYSSKNLNFKRQESVLSEKSIFSSEQTDPVKIAQMVDIKNKMLRHHNKKQVFAFNIYKNYVRKLSEHEIFNRQSDIGKISSGDSLEDSAPSGSQSSRQQGKFKNKVKFDLNLKGESGPGLAGNQTVQTDFRSKDNFTPLLNQFKNEAKEPVTAHLKVRTDGVWTANRMSEDERTESQPPDSSIKFHSIHLNSSRVSQINPVTPANYSKLKNVKDEQEEISAVIDFDKSPKTNESPEAAVSSSMMNAFRNYRLRVVEEQKNRGPPSEEMNHELIVEAQDDVEEIKKDTPKVADMAKNNAIKLDFTYVKALQISKAESLMLITSDSEVSWQIRHKSPQGITVIDENHQINPRPNLQQQQIPGISVIPQPNPQSNQMPQERQSIPSLTKPSGDRVFSARRGKQVTQQKRRSNLNMQAIATEPVAQTNPQLQQQNHNLQTHPQRPLSQDSQGRPPTSHLPLYPNMTQPTNRITSPTSAQPMNTRNSQIQQNADQNNSQRMFQNSQPFENIALLKNRKRTESKHILKNFASRLRDLSNDLSSNQQQKQSSVSQQKYNRKSRNGKMQSYGGNQGIGLEDTFSMFSSQNNQQWATQTVKHSKQQSFSFNQSQISLKKNHVFQTLNSDVSINNNKTQINLKKHIMKDVRNNLIDLCIDLGVENPNNTSYVNPRPINSPTNRRPQNAYAAQNAQSSQLTIETFRKQQSPNNLNNPKNLSIYSPPNYGSKKPSFIMSPQSYQSAVRNNQSSRNYHVSVSSGSRNSLSNVRVIRSPVGYHSTQPIDGTVSSVGQEFDNRNSEVVGQGNIRYSNMRNQMDNSSSAQGTSKHQVTQNVATTQTEFTMRQSRRENDYENYDSFRKDRSQGKSQYSQKKQSLQMEHSSENRQTFGQKNWVSRNNIISIEENDSVQNPTSEKQYNQNRQQNYGSHGRSKCLQYEFSQETQQTYKIGKTSQSRSRSRRKNERIHQSQQQYDKFTTLQPKSKRKSKSRSRNQTKVYPQIKNTGYSTQFQASYPQKPRYSINQSNQTAPKYISMIHHNHMNFVESSESLIPYTDGPQQSVPVTLEDELLSPLEIQKMQHIRYFMNKDNQPKGYESRYK